VTHAALSSVQLAAAINPHARALPRARPARPRGSPCFLCEWRLVKRAGGNCKALQRGAQAGQWGSIIFSLPSVLQLHIFVA